MPRTNPHLSKAVQMSKKKLITIPRIIILLLIVFLAIAGSWLGLRSLVASSMTNSIAELEQEGYEIGHGGLSVSGFPFVVDARTQNVSIAAPSSFEVDPSKNWTIKMDEVDVYTSTFTPLSWSALHSGEMRVDMRGLDGERYMFDVSPAEISADIAYSLSGAIKHFHANINRSRINSLVGSEPPVLALGGMRADLNVKAGQGQFDVLVKDVVLTEKYLGVAYNVLGKELSRVSINTGIENWQMLEMGDTAAWLDSPSRIKCDDWQVLWGDADFVGDFDIGFVNGLPDGVVRFRVKNSTQLLGKLINADLIPGPTLVQLGAYLNGLEADADGRKQIEITIRNGVVKYGFVTLYKF